MRRWMIVFLLVSIFALVGCGVLPDSAPEAPSPELLTPIAEVRGGIEGTFTIRMGIANNSSREIRESEDFEGRWQLLDASGAVRAAGHVYHLGSLGPEESRYPLAWESELEPGSYTLLWGAPSIGSVVVEFEAEVSNGAANVQGMTSAPSDDFPPGDGFVE
ncbi:MAG: hypothetical protein ACP5HS_00765 [Anaerolineae bacterium]